MEGLWSVLFSRGAGSYYGVAVFDGNRIFGGDSSFYWTGTYTVQNGQVNAQLDAVSHSGGAVLTVLGTAAQRFWVSLTAPAPTNPAVGTTVRATGTVNALLTRRA